MENDTMSTKKISIFYGGGTLEKEKIFSGEGSCPLCGDPLDHLIAEFQARASEQGYSSEEIVKRLNTSNPMPRIELSTQEIRIEGHLLEKLKPSIRAFYILLCIHPEGIEVGKDSLHENYLDEYQDIYYAMARSRKIKSSNGISFELDEMAQRYRTCIKEAIERLEEDTGLDLSKCCICGRRRWFIPAAGASIIRDSNTLIAIRNAHSTFAPDAGQTAFPAGRIPEL